MTQPLLPFPELEASESQEVPAAPLPDAPPDAPPDGLVEAPQAVELLPVYHVLKVPRDGLPWYQTLSSIEEVTDFLAQQLGEVCWCFVIEGGERLQITRHPNPCLVLRDGTRRPLTFHIESEIDPLGSMISEEPLPRRDHLPTA